MENLIEVKVFQCVELLFQYHFGVHQHRLFGSISLAESTAIRTFRFIRDLNLNPEIVPQYKKCLPLQ